MFGSDLLGSLIRGKPDMPAFNPINPQTAQQQTVQGNQAILPQTEAMAGGINSFNQQQLEQMLQSAIPGYKGMTTTGSTQIQSMLEGKLPQDVSDAVMRASAGTALTSGVGTDSGMGRNLVARDLGLTSLDVINKGISSAESWMGTIDKMAVPGLTDPTMGSFMNPQATFQDLQSERNAQFQHDWNKNLIDFQSSLGYAAADDIQSTTSAIMSMAGSAGMAGGSGGGY